MTVLSARCACALAPTNASPRRPAVVVRASAAHVSLRASGVGVGYFGRARLTHLRPCDHVVPVCAVSNSHFHAFPARPRANSHRHRVLRRTNVVAKPKSFALEADDTPSSGTSHETSHETTEKTNHDHTIPVPWHRFLTRTTLVVACMVVLYSASTPYAVQDKGVSFATATMKRLACVFVARAIATRLIKPPWVRRLAEGLGKRAGGETRAVITQLKTLFTQLKSFLTSISPLVRKEVMTDGEGEENTQNEKNAPGVVGFQKKESKLRLAVANAKAKYAANPKGILLIPLIAALVGWFTNWLAVKMIFFPIGFLGVNLFQAVEGRIYGYPVLNPLGFLGWQGIVPAKAAQMALTMVEMVTTKLINVEEVFLRLDPGKMAKLLLTEVPYIADGVVRDLTPNWAADFGLKVLPAQCGPVLVGLENVVERYLTGFVELVQMNTDKLVDLKELVVTEMCEDKKTLVELFQRCGRDELKFLTNSGLFFGFLLGCLQALAWLFYDNPWTLTFGGAVVGLATNWIALKCIFEPIEPVYLFNNPSLKIQGLFLQRQNEVSGEFSDHLASKVLTSEKVWNNLLNGGKGPEFEESLKQYTKEFLTLEANRLDAGMVFADDGGDLDPALVDEIVANVKTRLAEHVHVLHEYSDDALGLKDLMRERMALMTPKEFERVLHPIFEQDELTLIVSGAVLGALAGFAQQVWTVAVDGKEAGEGTGTDDVDGGSAHETEVLETSKETAEHLTPLQVRARAEALAAMAAATKTVSARRDEMKAVAAAERNELKAVADAERGMRDALKAVAEAERAEAKAVAEAERTMQRWPGESSREAGRWVFTKNK